MFSCLLYLLNKETFWFFATYKAKSIMRASCPVDAVNGLITWVCKCSYILSSSCFMYLISMMIALPKRNWYVEDVSLWTSWFTLEVELSPALCSTDPIKLKGLVWRTSIFLYLIANSKSRLINFKLFIWLCTVNTVFCQKLWSSSSSYLLISQGECMTS